MTRLNGPLVLLSTLVCGTALAVSAKANADATSFEMASYLNSPGGKEIVAGDYDAVIAKTTRSAWRLDAVSSLVASTNLCVAYTLKREIAAAESACAKAVTLAARIDNTPYTRFPRESATSKALSNRGVLRAVSGDPIGAANDFRQASAMKGAEEASGRNLAYLQSLPADRLALLGAAD